MDRDGDLLARLIYFSSVSNNTHRFVEKLGLDAVRLPVHTRDETYLATEPFVLVVPTYGGGSDGGAVPKQVIKFLNVEANRNLIRGVIAAGNTNFRDAFCLAGDVIAAKCRTHLLYRVELMGTPEDVESVRTGLEKFWKRTPSRRSA
jgi:protein involved in ribonucleotide reduction